MLITQNQNMQKSQLHSIKEAQYTIDQIDDTPGTSILTTAISNNLKYIAAGGQDKSLKIWRYKTNKRIKQIKLNNSVMSCKFADDFMLLYVGIPSRIYQFIAGNQFKKLCRLDQSCSYITNIYCVTDTVILNSTHKQIIKTDFNLKKSLLIIDAHNDYIIGLDYNKSIDVIVSGSHDKAIKLWSGKNGSLIIEKQNAHNVIQNICLVLFIINKSQLISQDVCGNLLIWNINYHSKQLEQLLLLNNSGCNISLVLNSQYILTTGKKFIKIYTILGELVRQFDHEVDEMWTFDTIQHESLKAVLIQGISRLFVCKLQLD